MTQRLRYTELAPAGIATMRGVEHYANTGTGLAPVLLELVRLRASLLNGCEYCIGMHSHELGKHNEPQSRIDDVARWRDSDAYTERERAAFAWTEAVTNIQQGHASDDAFRAVREHFSELETVDLTIAIGSINSWNRMAIAFRAQHRDQHRAKSADPKPESHQPASSPVGPDPEATAHEPIQDDGGKVEVED